jgi:hypothetical protein
LSKVDKPTFSASTAEWQLPLTQLSFTTGDDRPETRCSFSFNAVARTSVMLIGRSRRKMQNGWRSHFLNPQRIRKFIPYIAGRAQLAERCCEEISLVLVKE